MHYASILLFPWKALKQIFVALYVTTIMLKAIASAEVTLDAALLIAAKVAALKTLDFTSSHICFVLSGIVIILTFFTCTKYSSFCPYSKKRQYSYT